MNKFYMLSKQNQEEFRNELIKHFDEIHKEGFLRYLMDDIYSYSEEVLRSSYVKFYEGYVTHEVLTFIEDNPDVTNKESIETFCHELSLGDTWNYDCLKYFAYSRSIVPLLRSYLSIFDELNRIYDETPSEGKTFLCSFNRLYNVMMERRRAISDNKVM